MTMYRVLQEEHRLQPFRSLDFSSRYREHNYPATEAHTRRIANTLIANVVQKLA